MGAMASLVVSTLLFAQAPGHPVPDPEACAFTVAADGRAPEIVGPPEIVARARVVAQPDSPLVIRRVDLSDFVLLIGGSGVDYEGFYTMDVQNVSNRVIEDIRAGMSLWDEHRGATSGPRLKAPLAPGETVRLRTGGGRGGSVHPGESREDTVRLLFVVESVQLPGCFLKPAQAIPFTFTRR